MYEAHLWLGLAESPHDINAGGLKDKVGEIGQYLSRASWPTVKTTLYPVNGQYWLVLTVFANRRRDEAQWVSELLDYVNSSLPGSWGLLYERDDELEVPPGPNSFQVTVIARGATSVHPDPFLSPANPTIED